MSRMATMISHSRQSLSPAGHLGRRQGLPSGRRLIF